jgi:hypothetical protein
MGAPRICTPGTQPPNGPHPLCSQMHNSPLLDPQRLANVWRILQNGHQREHARRRRYLVLAHPLLKRVIGRLKDFRHLNSVQLMHLHESPKPVVKAHFPPITAKLAILIVLAPRIIAHLANRQAINALNFAIGSDESLKLGVAHVVEALR